MAADADQGPGREAFGLMSPSNQVNGDGARPADADDRIVLVVQGRSRAFGRVQAVRDLSLVVRAGEDGNDLLLVDLFGRHRPRRNEPHRGSGRDGRGCMRRSHSPSRPEPAEQRSYLGVLPADLLRHHPDSVLGSEYRREKATRVESSQIQGG